MAMSMVKIVLETSEQRLLGLLVRTMIATLSKVARHRKANQNYSGINFKN